MNPGDDLQQHGLPAAVFTPETYDGPGLHGQRHVAEQDLPLKALCDMVQLDDLHAGGPDLGNIIIRLLL